MGLSWAWLKWECGGDRLAHKEYAPDVHERLLAREEVSGTMGSEGGIVPSGEQSRARPFG